ncbi:hypothetical protein HD554DRAFT_2173343 [Boletus coccyginus]|nr:hypothetical protein HD554DRAFT_2173343 [Boletus coccyginus]
MSGAYTIVQQLFSTGNSTAVGIGYFVQALLNFAKHGGQSPIIVEHMNKEGATRVMVFSRQKLSTKFNDAMATLQQDFGITQRGYYSSQVKANVTGVLFYNEDGTVQTTPVMVSQESWPDLMAHVHKIFIRTPDV